MSDQDRDIAQLTSDWVNLKMDVDAAPTKKEKSRIAKEGLSKFTSHEINTIVKQILLHAL